MQENPTRILLLGYGKIANAISLFIIFLCVSPFLPRFFNFFLFAHFKLRKWPGKWKWEKEKAEDDVRRETNPRDLCVNCPFQSPFCRKRRKSAAKHNNIKNSSTLLVSTNVIDGSAQARKGQFTFNLIYINFNWKAGIYGCQRSWFGVKKLLLRVLNKAEITTGRKSVDNLVCFWCTQTNGVCDCVLLLLLFANSEGT